MRTSPMWYRNWIWRILIGADTESESDRESLSNARCQHDREVTGERSEEGGRAVNVTTNVLTTARSETYS